MDNIFNILYSAYIAKEPNKLFAIRQQQFVDSGKTILQLIRSDMALLNRVIVSQQSELIDLYGTDTSGYNGVKLAKWIIPKNSFANIFAVCVGYGNLLTKELNKQIEILHCNKQHDEVITLVVDMINNSELKSIDFLQWDTVTHGYNPESVQRLVGSIESNTNKAEAIKAIQTHKTIIESINPHQGQTFDNIIKGWQASKNELEPQQEPLTNQQYKTASRATNEAVSQNKEPQQEPTLESVEDILKPYFKARFKGFAPDSTDYLKERFVKDLLQLRGYNSKHIVTFLLLAFNSNEFNSNNGKVKTFKDWVQVCSTALCKPITYYKPSTLDCSTIVNTYIYFTLPTKR